MYKVAYITEEQAQELTGLQWAADSYFAPIQDDQGRWLISKQEVEGNTNESVKWVNNLPLSDYTPKQ